MCNLELQASSFDCFNIFSSFSMCFAHAYVPTCCSHIISAFAFSSSPKLRTLARGLTPGFLRFGGTRQDFMVFNPQRRLSSSAFTAGDEYKVYKVNLSGTMFTLLCSGAFPSHGSGMDGWMDSEWISSKIFSSCVVEPSCDKLELPPWLEQKLKSDWAKQQVILMSENMQRKFKRVKFTGTSCQTLPTLFVFFAPSNLTPFGQTWLYAVFKWRTA